MHQGWRNFTIFIRHLANRMAGFSRRHPLTAALAVVLCGSVVFAGVQVSAALAEKESLGDYGGLD